MAFLPVNIFAIILFLFAIIWGWEGEELRNLIAIFSAVFMFPLWTAPLFNIVDDTTCCTLVTVNGWLPTLFLFVFLWWNVALMYFTVAHLFETMDRDLLGRKKR